MMDAPTFHWRQVNGELIALSEMPVRRLLNLRRFIERKIESEPADPGLEMGYFTRAQDAVTEEIVRRATALGITAPAAGVVDTKKDAAVAQG